MAALAAELAPALPNGLPCGFWACLANPCNWSQFLPINPCLYISYWFYFLWLNPNWYRFWYQKWFWRNNLKDDFFLIGSWFSRICSLIWLNWKAFLTLSSGKGGWRLFIDSNRGFYSPNLIWLQPLLSAQYLTAAINNEFWVCYHSLGDQGIGPFDYIELLLLRFVVIGIYIYSRFGFAFPTWNASCKIRDRWTYRMPY